MFTKKSARQSVLNNCARLLVFLGMICVIAAPAEAQAIRKFTDARGVTYYTNQPPEDDPKPRPPTAPAPAASAPVAAASAPVAVASSPPASPPAPAVVPAKPTAPINPAMALGDWPPRALLKTPDPVK